MNECRPIRKPRIWSHGSVLLEKGLRISTPLSVVHSPVRAKRNVTAPAIATVPIDWTRSPHDVPGAVATPIAAMKTPERGDNYDLLPASVALRLGAPVCVHQHEPFAPGTASSIFGSRAVTVADAVRPTGSKVRVTVLVLG
jgi:hypothetical protein